MEESIELDLAVAEHVGIGCTAAGVLVEHIVHHSLPVFAGKIHEVEGDTNLAGHQFGHELVFFPLAVAVQGALGVVPVLHKHPKNIVALCFEQQGRDAGVNASG